MRRTVETSHKSPKWKINVQIGTLTLNRNLIVAQFCADPSARAPYLKSRRPLARNAKCLLQRESSLRNRSFLK